MTLHWFYTSMSFPGQSHFWNSLIFPGFPRPWEPQKKTHSPAGLFISTETMLLGPWAALSHAFCFNTPEKVFFSGPAPPWIPKYSNLSSLPCRSHSPQSVHFQRVQNTPTFPQTGGTGVWKWCLDVPGHLISNYIHATTSTAQQGN